MSEYCLCLAQDNHFAVTGRDLLDSIKCLEDNIAYAVQKIITLYQKNLHLEKRIDILTNEIYILSTFECYNFIGSETRTVERNDCRNHVDSIVTDLIFWSENCHEHDNHYVDEIKSFESIFNARMN